jgi:hypothetical protein
METVRGLVAGIVVVFVVTVEVEVVLGVEVVELGQDVVVDLVPGAERSCACTTVPSFRV